MNGLSFDELQSGCFILTILLSHDNVGTSILLVFAERYIPLRRYDRDWNMLNGVT
jgi:hypothetical protein